MTVLTQMQDSYPIEGVDIYSGDNYNASWQFIGIDFKKAKATRPSLKFCYVKLGEGWWDGYPLDVAKEQIASAGEAGFDVGAYEYDHPEYTVGEQAAYFKKRLQGVSYNLPIMIDAEDADLAKYRPPTKPITPAEVPGRMPGAISLITHIREMLDAFSQINGRPALLYTADWYLGWALWLAQMNGTDLTWVNKYPWFLASYTAPVMYLPMTLELKNVLIWQHTSTPAAPMQVNGFPNRTNVDMDYFIQDAAAYAQFCGKAVEPPPVIPPVSDAEKLARLWTVHPELHSW